MTTRTWSGANSAYTDATQWSGGVVPISGDIAVINSGTVNAAGLTLAGVTIQLNGTTGSAGTLVLNSDTLAAGTALTITDSNTFGATPAPTLTLTGTTANYGTMTFAGTTPIVTFTAGAALINYGTITINGASPQVQLANGAAAGSITNNGSIQVLNPSNDYQSAIVNATISGTGTISVGNSGAISFRQSIGSGQTIAFNNSTAAGSAVEIDLPTAFGATVSGFVQSDRLILTSIPYTKFSYAATSASSGTLTLFSGNTVESQIRLSGIYGQNDFTVTANPLGTSGLSNVIISTVVTNATTGAGSLGGSNIGAVYRFFDKGNGTHFFTADAGEKATVIATRSDLVGETNGFGAVAQSDTNATSIYRFFDTRFGTHFFTANAGERDNIIATRSDLTYEPTSTFFEHGTRQLGDVAVYRFFDKTFGTQFLTGDAGEFAGITTPGTSTFRTDLTFEGVGFYAPAGSFA